MELVISELGVGHPTYNPQVVASLLEAQEWDKLECWMGVVLMIWLPETEETTEDLKRMMVSLFHHQRGTAQKFTQWMKQWDQ